MSVTPGQNGLVLVEHGLGTPDVRVVCESPSGAAVGYLAAVALDDNRVEVALAPGTDVSAVLVEPLEN